jgi:uncharacterized Zn finger protein
MVVHTLDDSAWAQRWRGLLGEERPQDVRRFNQGRAFQRSGRVTGVRVDPGRIVGQVQGSRATPYLVEVMVGVLDDDGWRVFLEAVGGEVRHAARLLAGHPPDGLETQLEAAGVDLFGDPETVDARCACGEASRPCAHVVALWHDMGERIAEDPFVLLRLRGRGRERLLAELAAARRRRSGVEGVDGLDPAELSTRPWTRSPLDLADLEIGQGSAPETPAGPLKLLGDPPGWAGNVGAWDLFRPIVEQAARRAYDL